MDVFICHSGKDKEVVESICALLAANEITYWLAEQHELCGEDYIEQIFAAMDQSQMVLLLGSQNAMTSGDVMGEIAHAKERNIPRIPVQVGRLDKPQEDKFKYLVELKHFLTYAPTEEFSRALLTAISAHRKTPLDVLKFVALKKYANRKFGWWPAAIALVAVVALLVGLLLGRTPAPQPGGGDPAVTTTTTTAADNGTTTTPAPATTTTTGADTFDPAYNQVPEQYRQELEQFMRQSSKVGHTHTVKVGQSDTPFLAQTWTYVASYSTDTRIATVNGNEITGVSPGVAYVVLISSMGKTDIYEITVIE